MTPDKSTLYRGSEDDFQVTAINLVRMIATTAGVDREAVMHVPNGGLRAQTTATRLKSMGTVAGYPDLMAFAISDSHPEVFYYGLALELKVHPNKPTPQQLHVHGLLRKAGWKVEVCYGLDQVQRIAENYFKRN